MSLTLPILTAEANPPRKRRPWRVMLGLYFAFVIILLPGLIAALSWENPLRIKIGKSGVTFMRCAGWHAPSFVSDEEGGSLSFDIPDDPAYGSIDMVYVIYWFR